MSDRLVNVGAMFSPDVVAAIEQLIDERVAAALASLPSEASGAAPWLTLEQAAEVGIALCGKYDRFEVAPLDEVKDVAA